MPEPLIAAMPPDLDLPDGYIVRFNALDPSTGAHVAGVVVENVSIFAAALGTTAGIVFATGEPILLRQAQ